MQYLRLLIMRPSIIAAAHRSLLPLSEDSSHRTVDRLQNDICEMCVQAAIVTIDALVEDLKSPIRIMSSFAIATAFSAATVLVAASLAPDLVRRFDLPGTRVPQAWKVMRKHRWQVDGSRHAQRQLRDFIAKVEQIKARRTDLQSKLPSRIPVIVSTDMNDSAS